MVEWSLANLAAWAVQAAALVVARRLAADAAAARAPRGPGWSLFRALLVACIALPLVQPWTPAPAPVVPMAAAPPPIELAAAAPSPAVSPSPAPAAHRRGLLVRAGSSGGRRAAVGRDRAGRARRPARRSASRGWELGLVSLARLRRSSSPIDAGDAGRRGGRARRRRPRVVPPVAARAPSRSPSACVGPSSSSRPASPRSIRRSSWRSPATNCCTCGGRTGCARSATSWCARFFWFHPAIWWLVEQIRLSAEQLIDREVVGLVGDRRSYLRALLALAEAGAGPRFQPAPCFLDHGHLQKRVAMLMEEVSMSRLRLVVSAALVFAILVTGGWAVVRAFPLQAPRGRQPASGAAGSASAAGHAAASRRRHRRPRQPRPRRRLRPLRRSSPRRRRDPACRRLRRRWTKPRSSRASRPTRRTRRTTSCSRSCTRTPATWPAPLRRSRRRSRPCRRTQRLPAAGRLPQPARRLRRRRWTR